MKYIKIFGIQRTGTNYIQQLAQKNFINVNAYDNHMGWKHGPPLAPETIQKKWPKIDIEALRGNVHPIIMIKNPYSWQQSIKIWSNKKYNFNKVYKRYNYLYEVYRDFHLSGSDFWAKSYVLKYEDLLIDPEKIVNEIRNMVGCEITDKFVNPNTVPHQQNKKFTEKRKMFYLGTDNFGLSDNLIKAITNIIDWNVIEFYGYRRK